MRISLQPAYVLHRRPYRDSSLLLEVFTAEQGRLSLVSKGARRRARGGSLASMLQPFAPVLVSYSGRGDLKTLTASEAPRPAWHFVGDRMFSGLYINELLVRLLHRHDPHPTLFADYGETMEALAGGGAIADALRWFEWRLLNELGYGFALAMEADSGRAVVADSCYRYDSEVGLRRIHDSEQQREAAYPGAHLLAMSRGNFGGDARGSSKRLFREALAVQLGEHPLRSRELFSAARRRSANARVNDDSKRG